MKIQQSLLLLVWLTKYEKLKEAGGPGGAGGSGMDE